MILNIDEGFLDRDWIWVLSTGRTYTTSLWVMLRQECWEEAVTVHEHTFNAYGTPHHGIFGHRDLVFKGNETAIKICRDHILLQTAVYMSLYPKETKYIETNGGAHFQDIIEELMPNSKYVYLTRDPVEVVTSSYNRHTYGGSVFGEGQLQPPEAAWTRWEKCSWLYLKVNELTQAFLAKIPDSRKMHTTVENLDNCMPDLFDFMGLTAEPKPLQHFNTGPEGMVFMPDREIDHLYKVGADVIERCGYDPKK